MADCISAPNGSVGVAPAGCPGNDEVTEPCKQQRWCLFLYINKKNIKNWNLLGQPDGTERLGVSFGFVGCCCCRPAYYLLPPLLLPPLLPPPLLLPLCQPRPPSAR
jgi:hypothetical protein